MADDLSLAVQYARDLIRIDTQNYGEGKAVGEAAAADYIRSLLDEWGIASQTFESAPGRANLVAEIEGADPSLPKLVLHGHTDVVPADADEWSVDPLAGEIRDGLLWGRGAVDMKDMLGMMLQSVHDLVTNGEQPRRGIILTFFADEEAGGEYGSRWMAKEHPEVFAGAAEAISEVGGYSIEVAGQRAYLLQTAEKSIEWFELVAEGTAGHGSQTNRNNAVSKLGRALARLADYEFPQELRESTRALLTELAAMQGEEFTEERAQEIADSLGGISKFIGATTRTTMNPTMLNAGYKHNVVPSTATARVDMRPLPGRSEDALRTVQEIVGDDARVRRVTHDIGVESPFEGPLVDAIVAQIAKHDPEARVLPYMLSGGTDNKALATLGIAGYGFAPLKLPPELDFAGMFHGVDERVPVDAIDFGTAVLTDLLRAY